MRQGSESILPSHAAATTFAFSSAFILLLLYGWGMKCVLGTEESLIAVNIPGVGKGEQ